MLRRIDPIDKRLSGALMFAAPLLLLSACGGGGGSGAASNQPPPPPAPAAIQSGVFKDINVSGLTFSSGGESGTTDAAGRFTCETGADVSFDIGSVALGSASCSTLVSPPALVTSGRFEDPEAINIARFLQLLDVDGSPQNGITISSGIQEVADSWPTIDFSAEDLASQLTPVFSDIQSVDGRTVTELPSAADAFAHMDTILACAYGGAFVGSFSGTNNGAIAFAFARRLFGFSLNEFEFMAFDAEEEFILSTSGPYDLSVRSSFDSSAFDDSVLIEGSFSDPNTISGIWSFPPENSSGSFTASRISDDSGIGRHTGTFFANEARGVVSLTFLEDSSVTGTGFDIIEGTQFEISAPPVQSSQFDLTITGAGETLIANAELFVDSAGSVRMQGSWDDGSQSGGQFSTIGCRLNPDP